MCDEPRWQRDPDLREQDRLTRFKNMRHREVGVAAGLAFCAEHKIVVPQWLTVRAFKLVAKLLQEETSRNKGRANGSLARYRQDLVDFERWEEVRYYKEKRSELADYISEVRDIPSYEMPQLQSSHVRHWFLATMEKVYHAAMISLAKTFAFGGKESIKKSYLKLENDASEIPLFLDLWVLKELGLEDTIQLNIRSITPEILLYDPTTDKKAMPSTKARWFGTEGPTLEEAQQKAQKRRRTVG